MKQPKRIIGRFTKKIIKLNLPCSVCKKPIYITDETARTKKCLMHLDCYTRQTKKNGKNVAIQDHLDTKCSPEEDNKKRCKTGIRTNNHSAEKSPQVKSIRKEVCSIQKPVKDFEQEQSNTPTLMDGANKYNSSEENIWLTIKLGKVKKR